MRTPDFIWNEETGTATCILKTKTKEYVATATCHHDDQDMKSQRVGYQIALRKAEILYIQDMANDYKSKYKALEHLYSTVKTSHRFNPSSFEGMAIMRELTNALYDYTALRELLRERRASLKKFIADRDAFYKKIRLGRFKKKITS